MATIVATTSASPPAASVSRNRRTNGGNVRRSIALRSVTACSGGRRARTPTRLPGTPGPTVPGGARASVVEPVRPVDDLVETEHSRRADDADEVLAVAHGEDVDV